LHDVSQSSDIGDRRRGQLYLNPDAGFYVVAVPTSAGGEKIVAQCWAWRGTKGELVLDSLETLGDQMKEGQWKALLDHMADAITDDNKTNPDPVTRLMVGMGGGTPGRLSFVLGISAQPRVAGGYEGDSSTQYEVRSYERACRLPSSPRVHAEAVGLF
jgi:hypothetical protein